MNWIVLQTAIPVFILMMIGIWLTAKEFKKEFDAEEKEKKNSQEKDNNKDLDDNK